MILSKVDFRMQTKNCCFCFETAIKHNFFLPVQPDAQKPYKLVDYLVWKKYSTCHKHHKNADITDPWTFVP